MGPNPGSSNKTELRTLQNPLLRTLQFTYPGRSIQQCGV